MSIQYSTTHRSTCMTGLATDVGTSAVIKIFTGSVPATCATADTGTTLVTFAGNATQFGTNSSGVLTVSAIANANAGATGTAGYFRVYPTAATTTNSVIQGTVFQTTVIATNNTTAANSNVLNFASTTGVANGMSISGTGIVPGSTVLAFTGTTVTMSMASTAGVGNAVSITFGGDMSLNNTSITSGQTCTFNSFTITATGA